MATTLTPAQLAAELGTDARTARKFLRSVTPRDEQPGKGGRWEIKKAQVRSLRKRFTEFQAAQEAARQERSEKAQEAVQVTDDGAIDEDAGAVEELDEPTDEALAEIESEQD